MRSDRGNRSGTVERRIDMKVMVIVKANEDTESGVRPSTDPSPRPRSSCSASMFDGVDAAEYRDDILRLLFGCCHPELPATQQAALVLRIVSGVPVARIARAFLVSEAAMEQRLTRARTRFDREGATVLLEDQERRLWNPRLVAEGLALIDKAVRHRRPRPYQVQAAVAALHVRADRPEDTDWAVIEQLYAALERMQPSPVVALNRALAASKVLGAAEALALNRTVGSQAGCLRLFSRCARRLPARARPCRGGAGRPRHCPCQHACGGSPRPQPYRAIDAATPKAPRAIERQAADERPLLMPRSPLVLLTA